MILTQWIWDDRAGTRQPGDPRTKHAPGLLAAPSWSLPLRCAPSRQLQAQCSSSSLSCFSPCTYISTSGFTSFFNLSITMMGIFLFYPPPPPSTGCNFIGHFLPCKTTVKELEQEITTNQPNSIFLFVWSQSLAIFEQSHSVACWWHQC